MAVSPLPDFTRKPLRRPSIPDVLAQAKRDFIGKDVQQNTTYSYVWSADQAGHFMLGFVPSFILYWIACLLADSCGWVTPFAGKECGLAYSALLIVSLWTALELYDFYDSWRMSRESTGYFQFDADDLAWNVVAALIYFGLGAGVAALSQVGPGPVLLAIPILFALQFFFVGVWWLKVKIVFQQAGLPYLYRLANFNGTFATEDPERQKQIVAYILELTAPRAKAEGTGQIEPGFPRRHMILTGPESSGKSSLAAGIGTEFAFNGGIGRYMTMAELLGYATEKPSPRSRNQRDVLDTTEQEFNDGRILWQWPSVDLLVIDDVAEPLHSVRRMLEAKARRGELVGAMTKAVEDHPELAKLKGNGPPAMAVNEVAEAMQAELHAMTQLGPFAEFLKEEDGPVIEALKRIPRIVWVVGDSIAAHAFQEFVRKEFELAPDSRNLQLVSLT